MFCFFLCKWQKVFKENKSIRDVIEVSFPNGKFWHDLSISPLRSSSGEIKVAMALIRDVTEEKRLQNEIFRSKELFEKMFISMQNAAFILDDENPPIIRACNPSATNIFGYTDQEMLSRTTAFLHESEETLRAFQPQMARHRRV